MHDNSLRFPTINYLDFADPEVFGPFVLVLRVFDTMAVPAGRSVVFVTGNAKKLEEVKHLL